MAVGTVVRRAVAFAIAVAPCATLVNLQCSIGCDVQWQAPADLSCFQNPWMYSGPVTNGTMSSPGACGISDAGITAELCASICGAYGPNCLWDGNKGITCADVSKAMPHDTLCGRRPRGLRRARRPRSVGAHLADAARLELASVVAFETLFEELTRLRAPTTLRRAARRAAADERRHARMMSGLARRRGAKPRAAIFSPRADRELVAIAIENVIEGCVRETYGAAVAMWQAEHAPAADVRAVMREIARDESRHADLGWRVDAWSIAALDVQGYEAVRDAGLRAVRELMTTHASLPFTELGLPSEKDARAILESLWMTLWGPRFMA